MRFTTKKVKMLDNTEILKDQITEFLITLGKLLQVTLEKRMKTQEQVLQLQLI